MISKERAVELVNALLARELPTWEWARLIPELVVYAVEERSVGWLAYWTTPEAARDPLGAEPSTAAPTWSTGRTGASTGFPASTGTTTGRSATSGTSRASGFPTRSPPRYAASPPPPGPPLPCSTCARRPRGSACRRPGPT
ncbi:hypothetical protein ACFQ0M_07335 [Kitasatospora aburaviensis]